MEWGGGTPTALCAVVLAAGEGTRLRPITETLPKPLCPVGNVTLLDRALRRLADHGLAGPADVAVNACYLADQIVGHVGRRAHVSIEPGPRPLGTSGALYHLRDWIAGRPVLALNADAYLAPYEAPLRVTGGRDLAPLLDGWDGKTVRVLTVPAGERTVEFGGDLRFAGASLLPGHRVAALPSGPSDLVLTIWRPAERAGELATIPYAGRYLDTGTPADLLAANLDAAGDGSLVDPSATVTGRVVRSVVGAGARVAGSITRCMVLPGATVHPDEDLVEVIRAGDSITCHG